MEIEKTPRVLLLNGSPHSNGCTRTALDEVAKTLEQEEIDTEIVQIGQEHISGCIACRRCETTGRCKVDSYVSSLTERFLACDGIVIGSPVYYASASGNLISLLDKLFFSTETVDKTMKVGAAVVSARRGGCSATFDELNKYFLKSSMPVVSSQYWNSVHGYTPEDVRRDKEGMQTMRVLGRNMAFLIKSISLGRKAFGIPKTEPWQKTNFIR